MIQLCLMLQDLTGVDVTKFLDDASFKLSSPEPLGVTKSK